MNRKTLQHGLLLSTSILVSMAGYGRRAYAGSVGCVLSTGTTYICSGAFGETSISKDNAQVVTDGAIYMSTEQGALEISATGKLSFTDENASTIVSERGRGLSVDSTGHWVDEMEGYWQGLSIETNGTISGTTGIYARSNLDSIGGHLVSITVGGDVSGTEGWGIDAGHSGIGIIDITVEDEATVSGPGGIKAKIDAQSSDGDLTITVDGDVEATATDSKGYGLHVDILKYGSATLTLNEGASITSARSGAQISTYYGGITATIARYAAISGGTQRGLSLDTYDGSVEVTVDGEVKSDENLGLYAYSKYGNISVTVGKYGRVAGKAGIHLDAYYKYYGNGGYGDRSITVHGEVAASDGFAIQAEGGTYSDGVYYSAVELTVGKEGLVTSESAKYGAVILSGAKVSAVVAGKVRAKAGLKALHLIGYYETSLELLSGYEIQGDVVSDGLDLGILLLGGTETGADADTFDVSLIDNRVGGKEQFQGFGSFEKVGTGDWTLTGELTADVTEWSVGAGRLFVDATMSSTSFDVAADATLGGTGTIGGFRLVSGSHVAPGSAEGPGTLTVDDKVAFGGGSYFDVTVGKDEASKLVVKGGATIDRGATVSLNRIDDEADYTNGKSYVILSTEIGYKGKFSETIDENFAFLEVALVYEGNDVLLNLTRNAIDFETVAGTPDQKAVAAAIEGLEGGNAIYDAVAVLDETGAETAFETLSGNTLASVPNMVIGEAASFDALLEARSDAVAAGGSESAYVAQPEPANAAAAATADLLAPLASL